MRDDLEPVRPLLSKVPGDRKVFVEREIAPA